MVKAKNNSEGLLAQLLPEECEKVLLALLALDESKAERPMLFDLTARETFTDYIIVCHGTSDRHVDAIAEAVNKSLKTRGFTPIGIEGRDKSVWVLLDFGGLVLHVFHEPLRDFYDLEGLWADCPSLDIPALLAEFKLAAETPKKVRKPRAPKAEAKAEAALETPPKPKRAAAKAKPVAAQEKPKRVRKAPAKP